MKRLLLSFACLFAIAGTISHADIIVKDRESAKIASKDDMEYENLRLKLLNAKKEDKALLLNELVSHCDCSDPGQALYYLSIWSDESWGIENSTRHINYYFNDLSSNDFQTAKEIAAQKAPSNDLCRKIAYQMLKRQEDTRKREIDIFSKTR